MPVKYATLQAGDMLRFKSKSGPKAKDGTPFVGPSTWVTNTKGMKSQVDGSAAAVAYYAALATTASIEVIDQSNRSHTLTLRPIDTSHLEATVAALKRPTVS